MRPGAGRRGVGAARLRRAAGSYDAAGRPFTGADYDRALRTAFGAASAARVRAAYPAGSFASPAPAWAAVVTDRMWARGTQAQHDALAPHVPVYAYEFADRDAPMFLPLPGGFAFRAFHAGDVPYLFEDEAAEPRFYPAQRRLSATMTGYWAAFARTVRRMGPACPAGRRTVWTGRTRSPWRRSGSGPSTTRREHRLDFWDGLS
ncbi:carboxylesterase family protein [Streptomyces erythrochromogenes]|uniref:carboxylesterase family protein n=1 Tax=Streptomyces erythrochromogenes TaxID=285574 RepID=UPI00342112A3